MEVQSKAIPKIEQEEPKKAKNLQMQPEAISFLVKNFFTMYRMSAQWRIKNPSYVNPIQNFMEATEICLKKVQNRTHDKLLIAECPFNNLHYHNIFVLMKYVRILDDRSSQNKPLQFNNLMEQQLLRNNSTMALFLLLSNHAGEISGVKVCEAQSSNLCTEFELFSRIL